ncbi:MAG TPA: beta-ketoacyl synthase N-terminal-like domain-containing protein, partial [Tissierellaceae bacterium]|nr:beta-ketoacyl synthase N-terminal-like domain-containing protein [Tissierellaceae bacterium]
MNRVVITGLGAITPVGSGKEEFWNSIVSGKSGVGYVTKFDTKDHDVKIAAEVKDFDPTEYMGKKDAKRMDLFSQYAIAATKQALEDSGIDLEKVDLDRAGTIIG